MSLINVKDATTMQRMVTICVDVWRDSVEERRQDVGLQETKGAVDKGCWQAEDWGNELKGVGRLLWSPLGQE